MNPGAKDVFDKVTKKAISGIEFSPGEDYLGEGVSYGIARGILVFVDGRNITGEGMGIGAVALKSPSFSFFARNCSTTIITPGVIEKTFLVDSRLLWGPADSPSILLTMVLEKIMEWYMRWPAFQFLLPCGSRVRRALGLKPFFDPVPPVAEARFTYRIEKNKITVSCTIRPLGGGFASVFILNELAADSFTHGFFKGKVIRPPSGWVRFEPGNDLFDPQARIRFCFSYHSREGSIPGKVWWGREYTRDLRWSGFEIEFPGIDDMDKPLSCSYEVCFTGRNEDEVRRSG
jgi:hypothetical protein